MSSITKGTKAVILAGGKGSRLYPITYEIPKPLLPVKRKPIINYLVDLFFGHNVSSIFVSIDQNFRDEFDWWKKRYYPGKKISFSEETEPLGTFGGLWNLKSELASAPFFFTNGDELKQIDLSKMKEFHQKQGCLGTIALVKVPDAHNYGVVLCDKQGLVKEFLEKPENPPSKYISSGLYLLSPEIFDYHPGLKFSMIEKDLFPKLAQESKLSGFKFKGQWMDCGTWERYENGIKKWS